MTDSSKPFLLLQRRTQNLRKTKRVLLTKHPAQQPAIEMAVESSWSSPSADWAWRYPFHSPTCSGPWFPESRSDNPIPAVVRSSSKARFQ